MTPSDSQTAEKGATCVFVWFLSPYIQYIFSFIFVHIKQYQKLEVDRSWPLSSSLKCTVSWKAVLDPPGLSGCMASASLPKNGPAYVHAGHVYKGGHIYTYEQQREITKPPNMNTNSIFSQNCGLPMAIHLSNASENSSKPGPL